MTNKDTEYYQGQDVVIRFDVFADGEDTAPIRASVQVYDPDKEFLGKDTGLIKGNEVRYILDGNNVKKTGEYTFICKVRIKQLGDYTHIVRADVKKLPVPVKEEVA